MWKTYDKKKRIQKFKEAQYTRSICQKELDKFCFQHGIAYGDFRNLPTKTASDKALRGKTFDIAKNPKYDGYQKDLAAMVHKNFDKRSLLC